MKVTCTKLAAATRQLDEAIALLFAGRDPLGIRTLAAAAHGILSDLVEVKRPGDSWRKSLIEASSLSMKDALHVLNAAQNYLKHADRDPNEILSFDEEENDHVIFFATLELGELGGPLSFSMQTFQVWYLACHPEWLDRESEIVKKTAFAFNNLHMLKRQDRLVEGARFTDSMRSKYEAP